MNGLEFDNLRFCKSKFGWNQHQRRNSKS